MNLSLFLTLFLSSVLALVLFHIGFLGLWYLGFVTRLAGKRPEILTILQNSAVFFSFHVLLPKEHHSAIQSIVNCSVYIVIEVRL